VQSDPHCPTFVIFCPRHTLFIPDLKFIEQTIVTKGNLAHGEYVLVPEQGAAQEVAPDPAPEPAPEDLPATTLEGKPRFYA
jgi:hypothetical protein